MIEDLLDVSRITSGHLRLQLRDVELVALVRDAIASVAPSANAKKITISADLGSDIGTVRSDPDRMSQIVLNLLTNAVKFTPEGGRVDVGLWRHGAEVEIRIADTGKGIGANFLPHIFDAFRQEDTGMTRQHGGLGLGLAIVKQLVELQQGTIDVESPGIGQGSTFTARLPLPDVSAKREHSTSKKHPKAPGQNGNGNGPLKEKRVLLVEDDTTTRSGLALILQNAGLIVHEAESAAVAIASYSKTLPDIIISDIGLPGENGYALLRQIREQEARADRPPVPALALTAFVRDTDARAAIEAGFQAHLGKPVEPNQLLATLATLTEGMAEEAT